MNIFKTYLITTLLSCVIFLTIFSNYYNPDKRVVLSIDVTSVETYKESNDVMYSNNMLYRFTTQDVQCMQANIFYEARNQSINGKMAVAKVTMNRVVNNRFPNNVCDVVTAGKRDSNGNMIKYQCAFSWYCDGLGDRPNLKNKITFNAWVEAETIAFGMLRGELKHPTKATHYHTTTSKPYWYNHHTMVKLNVIDDHIMYVENPTI